MAFQLSPGVVVTEEDRTTVIPSVATTAGAFTGAFKWGPVDQVLTVDSENTLVENYGRPDDSTASYFFTAANFLSYGNNLKIVRVVDKSIARNSVSLPSGRVTTVNVTDSANTFTSAGNIVVTIAAPESGVQATGTAILSQTGIVSTIDMTLRGFGYSFPPEVVLEGGSGTGAEAVAVLGSGEIGSLVLFEEGNNYVSSSNIVIQNQQSTGALAELEIHYKITGLEFPGDTDYVAYNENSNIVVEGALVPGGIPAVIEPIIGYEIGNIYVLEPGSGYSSNDTLQFVGGQPMTDWDEPGILTYFELDEWQINTDPSTGAILSIVKIEDNYQQYRTTPNVFITRTSGGSGVDAVLAAELLDISGEIRYFNIINNGRGYIAPPVVKINRNRPEFLGLPVMTATANLGYGYVAQVNLLNPGAGGYNFTPNVTINKNSTIFPFNPDEEAVVLARLSAQVDDIVITNTGNGYTSAPNVIIIPNPNDVNNLTGQASAIASIGFTVTGVNITNRGSGYTSPPVVSIVNSANATATATATISLESLLIENNEVYDAAFVSGNLNFGEFAAKFPGTIGNSIMVSMADSQSFDNWRYAGLFDTAPSTSGYAQSRNGSNDELHVVVLDGTSEITGTLGTVLEKFSFLSKARDAKNSDGSSNYYKDVINNNSKYIYVLDAPLQTSNWGASAVSTVFDTLASNVTTMLSAGIDGNDVSLANISSGYNYFSNDELYDVSLIPMGPTSAAGVVNSVISLAENRRDCLVFASPPYNDVVNTVNQASKITQYRDTLTSSSYAVLDSGWKYQYDRYNDKYRYVPLNGDTAGLAARTDYVADPWFSPAGYNRGVIKNVVKLAFSPNKTDRDTLYKKGINPIVTFPGQGTLLFGDKTLLARPSAFDRINVRRLFIVLEKAIATASKFQLFEFNDAFTRAQFRNLVEPFLRDVQGRRGITDFRVICDETNNTPTVIDRNEFVADIFIKPARAINFIQLNFIATRSGVSFEEVGA